MDGDAVTPRCGRVMQRREAVWGPQPEPPQCARPEGHNGPCRSAMALKRDHKKNLARQRRWRPGRRVRAGQAAARVRRAA